MRMFNPAFGGEIPPTQVRLPFSLEPYKPKPRAC
jgi:hypothetical protein